MGEGVERFKDSGLRFLPGTWNLEPVRVNMPEYQYTIYISY
jgi:hypothetical protein